MTARVVLYQSMMLAMNIEEHTPEEICEPISNNASQAAIFRCWFKDENKPP